MVGNSLINPIVKGNDGIDNLPVYVVLIECGTHRAMGHHFLLAFYFRSTFGIISAIHRNNGIRLETYAESLQAFEQLDLFEAGVDVQAALVIC